MSQDHKIFVEYGNKPFEMITDILSKLKLERLIKKDARIGIKPNLVVAKPSTSGATTSDKLCEAVIAYLQSHNFSNIAILESSWVGEKTPRAFEACGFTKISQKYEVPLIDLQTDTASAYTVDGVKINVCDQINDIDFLINMPVLKGHCQTKITCALKNLKGCIPNKEKRRFHTMGLHRPIACLNKVIKTDLIIVDGLTGDLNYEEGGNPVQMDRIIVGFDPVLVDSYVAELMGYNPRQIGYIEMAANLGVGSILEDIEQICEFNKQRNTKKIPYSREVAKLAQYVDEKDACSACYGSLIHALARLNEQGLLKKINQKICIGQGYQGEKHGSGIGIGSCTRGFDKSVPGCPPTAKDIIKALKPDNLK